MAGALEGLVVLDLTQQLVGPGATMLLGDMGADVIRIDPPPQLAMRGAEGQGRPRTALNMGRSKRSIGIDLGQEGGRKIVYEIARRADVLVQNYRPGVAERLGMGYERIREINPRIIYCEINAYGQKGSDRHRVGFDIIAQGGGGSMVPNWRDPDLPAPVSAPIADVTGMVLAALGIVAALRHRDRTGEGQVVRTSLLDAVVLNAILRLISVENEDANERQAILSGARAMLANGASFADISTATATGMGGQSTSAGGGSAGISPNIYYRTYRTKDSFIAVGCLNARQQRRLNDALGLGDPRFADDGAGLTASISTELLAALQEKAEELFRQRATQEWIDYLDSKDVACGPVLTVPELFESRHHLENEMITQYDDPYIGPVKLLGYPLKFDRTPMRMQRPAPIQGQFTEEILTWLGYRSGEIDALRRRGVVF